MLMTAKTILNITILQFLSSETQQKTWKLPLPEAASKTYLILFVFPFTKGAFKFASFSWENARRLAFVIIFIAQRERVLEIIGKISKK